jgi:hypothetical protein
MIDPPRLHFEDKKTNSVPNEKGQKGDEKFEAVPKG